jgi:glycosyltransferase involved in cell wall biosynthesis
MALAAAQWLAGRHELHIAVRRGPLRDSFGACGTLLRASPTLPLGGGGAARWALDAARSVLDGVRIGIYVRRHRIAVVHTNSVVLLGPVIGARLGGARAVVYARELPRDRRSRALFAVLARLAHTVIAVSSAVEAALPSGRGVRVVRIPDGIPVPVVAPPRNGLHSPLRLCLIGTVNGDGRKGQDLAIDAVARLRDRGLSARLELVGPVQARADKDALLELARAHAVDDRVRLAGPSDRIDDVLAETDILLSCARSEPLGLTVMEALARETPVVATRVGGVVDIVRDGETGLLVAPEDAQALADAVAALAADPARARQMARRGRADVAQRFDRDRGLAALEDELVRAAR